MNAATAHPQDDEDSLGSGFAKGLGIGIAIAAGLLLARDASICPSGPASSARAEWTRAALPAAHSSPIPETAKPSRADRDGAQAPEPEARSSAPAPDLDEPRAAPEGPGLTPDGGALAAIVAQSGDNEGKPYAIVDKRLARVMLFNGRGYLVASSPALLGKARGDDSAPGIGEKPLSAIQESEKTTPAGRFVSEPGLNAGGEDVIWVDYGAAVSMHRARTANPAERRLERMASADPEDHRISFGCINVPAPFFDRYLKPSLGSAKALVYVLPETRELAEQFPGLAKRRGA